MTTGAKVKQFLVSGIRAGLYIYETDFVLRNRIASVHRASEMF